MGLVSRLGLAPRSSLCRNVFSNTATSHDNHAVEGRGFVFLEQVPFVKWCIVGAPKGVPFKHLTSENSHCPFQIFRIVG